MKTAGPRDGLQKNYAKSPNYSYVIIWIYFGDHKLINQGVFFGVGDDPLKALKFRKL